MFTFLLFLVGIALIAFPFISFVPSLKKFGPKTLKSKIMFPLIGIGSFFVSDALFYASPGEYYLVQYIWGTQKVVMEPGPHLKFWGNLIKFKKVVTIKQSKNTGNASRSLPSIGVRFNDSVTAKVSVTTRFQMPSDPAKFKAIALEYRSQDNLLDSSLVPMTAQIARNSARLISAQDYISGKGGEFEFALRDQMENGQYKLRTIEIGGKRVKQKIVKDKPRNVEGDKVKKYQVEIVKDASGAPVRLDLVTTKYNMKLSDINVEDVDPDDAFDKRLDKQRDAAAQGNIAKQEAQKAEYDKQRIIAEGERDKAEEKAKQEKIQVTELISAETERKKAFEEKKTAAIHLDTARLEAKKIKALADAEAYKKKAVMLADGALEIKLKALKEINKYYAEALSKHKQIVPTTVIGSSGKGSNSAIDLISLLTAKTARDLSVNLKPSK